MFDALADVLERHGTSPHEMQTLDRQAERIAALPPAAQSAAYLHVLAETASTRGQRLLLLVDNTDFLLANIGKEAQWALREVLQSQSHLLWVGGSYQSLEANSEYHDAFLDFFRVLELRPLKLAEMQDALLALACTFGGEAAHAQMRATLESQPERLATLRQLSGGNPRTTVMLYTLLASTQAGQVRSDLEALLDELTPLYKNRLESLADLPRKLLAHILEHWSPIALGALERASQIKGSTISGQLKRLEQEGLIEKASLHGTTRSGYQAAERLFNIWYLMRLSPRRRRAHLVWLVEFMRLWFSRAELQNLAQERLGASRRSPGGHRKHRFDLEYEHALAEALPAECSERHQLRWDIFKQLRAQHTQVSELFDLEGVDQEFRSADDYIRRFEAAREQLQQCPHPQTTEERDQWVAAVMGSLNLSLEAKERIAQAAATVSRNQYDSLRQVLTDEYDACSKSIGPNSAEQIRQAVLACNFFPDTPDALLAFEQIRACFSTLAPACELACTLLDNQQDNEWTFKTLCWAEQQFPGDIDFAFARAWLLHARLGRYAEAEAAYREAIARDEKAALPVANLARLLWRQGRQGEAQALFKQTVPLSQAGDHNLRLQAHLALGNKQLALDALHALVEAAQAGDALAFYALKEQVWECHEMGLGETLADWLLESADALFLQPFAQALYELAGARQKLQDLPLEVQQMADEVVRQGLARDEEKQNINVTFCT